MRKYTFNSIVSRRLILASHDLADQRQYDRMAILDIMNQFQKIFELMNNNNVKIWKTLDQS